MRYSLFNPELMIRKCLMRIHLVIRLLFIYYYYLSITRNMLTAFQIKYIKGLISCPCKYCDDPRLTDRIIPTKHNCKLTHFSIDVATKGHCLRN